MRSLTFAAVGSLVLVVAEITVFVLLAHLVGWGWAVLAGLVTGAVGAVLTKRAGVRAWRSFRGAVGAGRPAGGEVADGLTRLLAGLLLLTPGFITDAAGLLLLLPPVRHLTARQLRGYAERRISPAAAGGLFGPRVVRATRGDTVPGQHPRGTGSGTGGTTGGDTVGGDTVGGDVVEGTIVEP